MRNKAMDYTALTLSIIGAVNWGSHESSTLWSDSAVSI